MKRLKLQSNETGEDCRCKRLKCFLRVEENDRKFLLNYFNSKQSNNEPNAFLASMISLVPIKRRKSRLCDYEIMWCYCKRQNAVNLHPFV